MKAVAFLLVILCASATCVVARHRTHERAAPKVAVNVYVESLCPGCRQMVRDSLFPAFSDGLHRIMDLNVVMFGWTVETEVSPGVWNFSCQHGEEECRGNMIETCAMHHYPDVRLHFKFINCLDSTIDSFAVAAPRCAADVGMDWKKINTCVNGAEGNKLQHEMGVKTHALRPALEHVPWITINGHHFNEDVDSDPVVTICQAYKGNITGVNPCTKLDVSLYYESYCPGCRQVLTEQLFPALRSGGLDRIIKLTLAPYGNTKQIRTNGTSDETRYSYSCQHGPEECATDVFEQSAIDQYPGEPALNFIYCVENSSQPLSSVQSCAERSGIDLDDLNETVTDFGWYLQEMYANMTNALVPRHKWVPWATINGQHLGVKCDTDVVTCICNQYKGVVQVAACKHHVQYSPSNSTPVKCPATSHERKKHHVRSRAFDRAPTAE